MNDERDPMIESLFKDAEKELDGDVFTERVIAGVNRRHRRIVGVRIAIILALVVVELMTTEPIQNTVGAATQLLSTQLLDLGEGWFSTLFGPLNSVLGIVGLLLIGMQALYRRVTH